MQACSHGVRQRGGDWPCHRGFDEAGGFVGQAAGGGAVHDLPASALADPLPYLRGVQELQRRDQSLHLRAAVVSNWRRRLEQLSGPPSGHLEASLCLLQSLHPLRSGTRHNVTLLVL